MPSSYGAIARGGRPRVKPRSLALGELPRGPRPPTIGPLRRFKPPVAPGSGLRAEPHRGHGYPEPPEDWQDGRPEWAVYFAHGPVGRGRVGGTWLYGVPFGGSFGIAGFVPDFLELDVSIAIDVYGREEESAGNPAATVRLREAIMAHLGYLYRVIDAEIALADPITALRQALAGLPTSKYQ